MVKNFSVSMTALSVKQVKKAKSYRFNFFLIIQEIRQQVILHLRGSQERFLHMQYFIKTVF